MGRRVAYLGTAVFLGTTVLLGVAWPEARLAFIALAAAEIIGGWWLIKRLPARPASSRELRGAAAAAFVLGISLAALFPSTRIKCDCPAPRGTVGGHVCNCPVDRHTVLRGAFASGGIVVASALARRSRRQGAPILEDA